MVKDATEPARLLVVFGTRPEVIKLAPVVMEARRRSREFELTMLATGQHREMLRQALATFDLAPDLDLDLMRPDQALTGLAAEALGGIARAIGEVRPDWVVVQGDTTTAFVAALAAFYSRCKVAHVEAGLRTGRLDNPYPEEGNRQLIGRLAALHLAPTALAQRNLLAEGIDSSRIVVAGNTVVDAIGWFVKRGGPARAVLPPVLDGLRDGFIFVTCHRREHFGDGLRSICLALERIARAHPQRTMVFPVHLNPNVRDTVHSMLGNVPNIRLTEPLDYEAALALLARADLVLTDSGGIQEEAPSFGVPVVVMREHTERMEGVAGGFAVLAGVNTDSIVRHAETFLNDPGLRDQLRARPNPYGDGRAAARILDALAHDGAQRAELSAEILSTPVRRKSRQ